MKHFNFFRTVLIGVCALLASAQLHGALITSVVETGGDNEATDTIIAQWTGQTFPVSVNNEPVPGLVVGNSYTVGLFDNHAPAFVDRNHRYTNASDTVLIPAYLMGGEYIMSGNDNRDNNPGYRLDVTVSAPVNVYMLIDNRLGGNNVDPPTFDATHMQWILDEAWAPVTNGFNRTANPAVPDEVAIDESADGTLNQWYSLYTKTFPAGTFQIKQADNAGQNMYGVVITLAADPTNLPPAIVDLVPANNGSFHDAATGLSFTVRTLEPNDIPTSNIQLILNGTDVTASLMFSGNPTNRVVTFAGLQANTIYRGVVSAQDSAGRGVTNTWSFDTFAATAKVIEVEDYNFGDGDCTDPANPFDSSFGGIFIDSPVPWERPQAGYFTAVGTREVDYHDSSTTRGTAANQYRQCDFSGTRSSADTRRAAYVAANTNEVEVFQLNNDDWMNYSRTFSAGNYAVYLRVASSGAGTFRLDYVSGDVGSVDQTTTAAGTFLVPNTSGAYRYVRLTDAVGNDAVVSFPAGTATVRLTAVSANNNVQANFLLLVPVAAAVPPTLTSVSPAPDTIDVPLDAVITASIANGDTDVVLNSIVLKFNDVNVTGDAMINTANDIVTITYDPPDLTLNTTYTVYLQFSDNGTPARSFTNVWSFLSDRDAPFITTVSQGTANHWGNAIWRIPPDTTLTMPVAGERYETAANGTLYGSNTGNTRIRNPASGSGDAEIGVKTFPGDSLTLNANTDIRAKGVANGVGNVLDFPGVNGQPGLILNGGALNPGDDGTFSISGAIRVDSTSLFAMADNGLGALRARFWNIGASISGSGSLMILQGMPDAPSVDVFSGDNIYSGAWIIKAGSLKGTGANSLGTGNIIVDGFAEVPAGLINPATVLNNGPAVLEINYDIVSPGTLTLGTNGQMILHQDATFGGLVINGTPLADGTYLYDELVLTYPNNFAPGGSGSITVAGSQPVSIALGNVSLSGTTMTFSFNTVNGVSYTVEYKDDLNQANWTTLQVVVGTGTPANVTASTLAAAGRFFRVRSP